MKPVSNVLDAEFWEMRAESEIAAVIARRQEKDESSSFYEDDAGFLLPSSASDP